MLAIILMPQQSFGQMADPSWTDEERHRTQHAVASPTGLLGWVGQHSTVARIC